MTEIERYQVVVLVDCPFCKKAISLLKERNEKFGVLVLDNDQEYLNRLKAHYNWKTVPIITALTKDSAQEILIGGCSDLENYFNSKVQETNED